MRSYILKYGTELPVHSLLSYSARRSKLILQLGIPEEVGRGTAAEILPRPVGLLDAHNRHYCLVGPIIRFTAYIHRCRRRSVDFMEVANTCFNSGEREDWSSRALPAYFQQKAGFLCFFIATDAFSKHHHGDADV